MKALTKLARTGLFLAILSAPVAAFAQATPTFNLPAQALSESLRDVGSQTQINVIFDPAAVKGLKARALKGSIQPKQALAELLKGTGFTAVFTSATTVVIKRSARRPPRAKKEQPSVRTLDQVVVLGHASAISATRSNTPIREIPQSVSVITRETLDQQNATDLPSALQYEPGFQLAQTSSQQTYIYSRGFKVDSVHIDGGAPIQTVDGSVDVTSRDLAEYDNIQVLRGSDALFGGMGNPSASISLQRKEPTPDLQASFQTSIGSWDQRRAVGDVGGPMTDELSGRVVLALDSRAYYYGTANDRNGMLYGVMKYQFNPSTSLSFGGSYERDNAVNNFSGLPWYDNGVTPQLSRSLSLTLPWAKDQNSFVESFAKLEHDFSQNWKLQMNATDLREAMPTSNNISYDGPISSSTNLLPGGFSSYGGGLDNVQQMTNATLTGKFSWWGHQQEAVFGGDYEHSITSAKILISEPFGSPIDPFGFDPALYPSTPASAFADVASRNGLIQWGIYSALRLVPVNHFALTIGGRYSTYREYVSQSLSIPAYGITQPTTSTNYDNKRKFTPYAGITYDISKHYTLYASYADIYHANEGELDSSLRPLPASDGNTMEAGVKAAWFHNLLNGALTVYKTNQEGVGLLNLAANLTGVSGCCWVPQTIKSKGFEANLTGMLSPHWQMTAGYTYNEHVTTSSTPSLVSEMPKHTVKLWTNYRLEPSWSFGGGVQAFSKNMVSECYPDTTPCAHFVRFEQGFYSVVSLRAAYDFTDHWSAALNVNNIFDRKYFSALKQLEYGNWYGAPRNLMLTIVGKL